MNRFILIFLFIYTNCYTQNFNASLIGGITTTQISGDQLSGFNKIGPKIGLSINRTINWYGIKLELQYLTKGSKKNYNTLNQETYMDNVTFDYNLQLNYIGVPILLFSNIKKNIQFELGAAMNILIKSKEEINFYTDDSRNFKNTETSILMGVQYKINEKYSLNTRFCNSILPIRSHASGEEYRLNKGQYNTVLSFSLYYSL